MKKNLVGLALATLAFVAPARANTEATDEINELLRGELSAIDTYQQALKKLGDEPGAKHLKNALSNHQDAAKKLTAEVAKLKGTPSTDAGAWGTWAQTVVGSAKILGDQAALKALKEGEEHGLKEYKDALEDMDIPASVKNLIRTKLIGQQEKHIASIDQLMGDKKEDKKAAK